MIEQEIEPNPGALPDLEAGPLSSFEPDPEAEPKHEPAEGIDYDRIIEGLAQKLTGSQSQEEQAKDPYSDAASYIFDNPAEAIQRTVDLATRNAIAAMLPHVQPMQHSFGMNQVTQGLNEHGQQFVHSFIQEKGINPALLSDPTIADLIRSKAELHQIRKGGQEPIPATETVGGYPAAHLDAEARKELSGIEKLYKSLGVKFDPARILGRMK
jgi:hypothetical protein